MSPVFPGCGEPAHLSIMRQRRNLRLWISSLSLKDIDEYHRFFQSFRMMFWYFSEQNILLIILLEIRFSKINCSPNILSVIQPYSGWDLQKENMICHAKKRNHAMYTFYGRDSKLIDISVQIWDYSRYCFVKWQVVGELTFSYQFIKNQTLCIQFSFQCS